MHTETPMSTGGAELSRPHTGVQQRDRVMCPGHDGEPDTRERAGESEHGILVEANLPECCISSADLSTRHQKLIASWLSGRFPRRSAAACRGPQGEGQAWSSVFVERFSYLLPVCCSFQVRLCSLKESTDLKSTTF